MEALAGGLVFISLLPMTLIGLAFAYLALRIRDAKADPPDPELGIKSAYYFFVTVGVLLALTGLTVSVGDLIADAFEKPAAKQQQFNNQGGGFGQPKGGPFVQPAPMQMNPGNDPFDSVSQRLAWPLIISGSLFGVLGVLLLKIGTNDARFPAARRTFAGLRLAVCGMNAMAAVTMLILLLFQKDQPNGRIQLVGDTKTLAYTIGAIAVWLPAAVIHVFMMGQYGKLPYYVPPKAKKKVTYIEDEEDEEDERDRKPPVRDRKKPPRRAEDEQG